MDIRTPVATLGGDSLPRRMELWKTQCNELTAKWGASIESIWMPGERATDMPIVWVKREKAIEILRFIKEAPGLEYGFLSDITATDELHEVAGTSEPRFHVVYNLFSHAQKLRIRVKVKVAEGQPMPTLTNVWPGANWAEREVWDMFGIKFEGHPDLRRILMDERWEGHPLRKDYPLRGYQLFTEPMAPKEELLQ